MNLLFIMIKMVVKSTAFTFISFISKYYFIKIAGRIQEGRGKKKKLADKSEEIRYNMGMKTYRYIVKGRVQGVAFRHYTLRAAQDYTIHGTVKNLPNGDVEVYAQGEPENISRFEAFLGTGPRSAQVAEVSHQEWDSEELYHGFYIDY